ncbi:chemotaxis protein CheW [Christensenellaceae bacterium OttesenSCG-928-M15]|nr:chemotaxis protein CheW [Christensenellaceae bacterium OttesenSCG-928-M15]
MPDDHEAIDDMFLVFTMEEQNYAVEIHYVTEIIEMMPITNVPNLPSCLKGIINLRGSVIPVMDVRLRFGLMETDYTERTCIIVVDNEGMMLGLIVDAVQECMTIDEEKRMPPPSTNVGGNARYIKGVSRNGNSIQLLLDCDKLMDLMG